LALHSYIVVFFYRNFHKRGILVLESQEKDLLDLLKLVTAEGRMSNTVCNALLPLVVMPNVEFIAFRSSEDATEILLIRRPDDLPPESYPGHWHCPGTMLLPSDRRIEDAYERIRTGKMRSTEIGTPRFLDFQLYHDPHRNNATFLRMVHLVEVIGEPKAGQFFQLLPEATLPSPLVWEQPMLIRATAMAGFRSPQKY